MTKATVTKTGNSYALRVPKSYIDDNNLKLGDIVELDNPLAKQQRALEALIAYSEKAGPLKEIPDPVAWQREQRKWTNPWDEIKNDSSR